MSVGVWLVLDVSGIVSVPFGGAVYMCMCVGECVRVCVRVCGCVCVCVLVGLCVTCHVLWVLSISGVYCVL